MTWPWPVLQVLQVPGHGAPGWSQQCYRLTRALAIGSKFIGVNNRDLHSFKVDLDTTTNLVKSVPSDVVLAALSGISGRADVAKYESEGVSAVLVGESLMRAADTEAFVKELLGKN